MMLAAVVANASRRRPASHCHWRKLAEGAA